MQIVSVRENPEFKEQAIQYFQSKWANESSKMVYRDCITNCIGVKTPLPQWYLLMNGEHYLLKRSVVGMDMERYY